ncbi:MAG: 3-deoxy-8-phosphooctulonate synthase [Acidobacteriota bacterium]|nr:3-deoxy-8-phosphooctulonate synthase [Acidobacteriota bacterium]
MSFKFEIDGRDFERGGPYLLIAGPCVIESEAHAYGMAEKLADIVAPWRDEFIWVFKSSFDKANRSSGRSRRGPGMEEGLRILRRIKEELDVPVLTDIHEPDQAAPVAEVVDILQIPAFLCRQTNLLHAAAETGRIVNIKKGQFVAPHDMKHPVAKVKDAGNDKVMITERGTSFGYNNLIVDFAGVHGMKAIGAPVIMDATHSVQLPGGLGDVSGGRREVAPFIARAAAAVGVDGFFTEVHDNPDEAWSDGPNQLTLELFRDLLPVLTAVRKAVS